MLTGYAAGKLDQISRNFPKQFSSVISLEKCWENLKKNPPKQKEIFFAKCLFCKSFRKFKLARNFILFVSFMKAQLKCCPGNIFRQQQKEGKIFTVRK